MPECVITAPVSGFHRSRPNQGRIKMSYYRAYIIGRDSQFQKAVQLDSANDNAAIESAKQLIDDYDIEVWQQDRLVTKLTTSDDT